MSSPAAPAEAAVTRPPVLSLTQQSTTAWTPGAFLARETAIAAADRTPQSYRVQPGDTLSSIAAHVYHSRSDWPVIYWRNHRQIRWANQISAGQVLDIPAKPARTPHAPSRLGPPAPAPAPAPAAASGTGTTPVAVASYSGTYPGGAFGACVVARESGGNPQIMNASGHYGLYQFSAATWAAYGGSPADFGHASVAEQNQVFANALAAGGESNWAPYDGC
jgi:LysM repeat protein